jgi:DNA-binding transcriptional regulator YiaG
VSSMGYGEVAPPARPAPNMKPKTIAEWRQRANISQQELAESVEISVSVVSKWERNMHVPRPAIKRLICQAISARVGFPVSLDTVIWPRREAEAG